ncbi:MAG: ferrous iron transport protein B [Ruminococcus sp.]|nr:ferrous iron transport protein B [Ruminococcus sp.]
MEDKNILVALAGNPNVGKSTVFNALTGAKQHTGNWAGKTVACAEGEYTYAERRFTLADIPGTYSLRAGSAEETTARDFICFGGAKAAVVVCDASCLERNLNLALQVMSVIPRTVVCVNLIDEAAGKGITVDTDRLAERLGVPVVAAAARSGVGLAELREAVHRVTAAESPPSPARVPLPQPIEEAAAELAELMGGSSRKAAALRLMEGDRGFISEAEKHGAISIQDGDRLGGIMARLAESGYRGEHIADAVIASFSELAAEIAAEVVTCSAAEPYRRDRFLDRIFLSRTTGIPVMLALFLLLMWLTVAGANYPSELLSTLLGKGGDLMSAGLHRAGAPDWLEGVLVDGIYRTLAWVVSVMLPPMAIFFPLFTLMEDMGYLPRIAFNLDGCFKCAGACGKQAITMSMGIGCNACGVTGCRIIDSPRERLIAVITNSLVPCNGRFPTIIAVITMFVAASPVIQGGALGLTILLGVAATLLASKLLSATVLRGEPSSYTLELPPYRRPQVGKVLVRSLLDRTIFVLGRACTAAAPCGLLIWLMANVRISGDTLLATVSGALDPVGRLMGLDGVILLAFVLGFPANEIVVPIILMAYLANGTLVEMEDMAELRDILTANGWTLKTAVCMLIFTLFHFPCATTCMTIRKETGSLRWTALSFALPTAAGVVLCTAADLLFSALGY